VIYLWRRQRQAAIFSLVLLIVPTVVIYAGSDSACYFQTTISDHVESGDIDSGGGGVYLHPLPPLSVNEEGESRGRLIPLIKIVGVVVLVGIVGLSGLALDEYYYHYQKAADWRGLNAYLHRVTTANDMVIITAADAYGTAATEFSTTTLVLRKSWCCPIQTTICKRRYNRILLNTIPYI